MGPEGVREEEEPARTAPDEVRGPEPSPGGLGLPRRVSWAGWLTGLLLLGGLGVVVARLGEEQRFLALLRQARPAWLVVALLFQGGTYVCAAAVWERALRRGGVVIGLGGLVPLGLAKLFADQALPSGGLSGTVLVVRALRRRGISRGLAVGAMLAGLVSFYAAYALAVASALGLLWRLGEIHRLLLALAALFGAVALGLPLAVLWLRGRAARALPRWMRILPGSQELGGALAEAPRAAILGRRLAIETIALQLAIFVLDAATLGVMLRALAVPVAPTPVFASFVIASFVATLAWVPGGLGTFEGTCTTMLHLHGVSIEAALAATLLLRGFTFWLPMAPGLLIARRETRGG